MSREPGAAVIIEWSPSAVSAFDPIARRHYKAASLPELASGLRVSDAVFAVSRRACFIREIPVPSAPKDEVKQALRLSLGQHIPLSTDETCFDIRLTQDVGPRGQTATLAAMSASNLRLLHDQARAAGIRPLAVMPAAFGSLIVSESQGIKNGAVVSEGIEGLAADLVAGGELRYSRALPPELSAAGLELEIDRTFGAAGLPCMPTVAAGVAIEGAEYRSQQSPIEALSSGWQRVGVHLELPEAIVLRRKASQALRNRVAILLSFGALAAMAWVAMDRAAAQGQANRQRAQLSTALRKMNATRTAVRADLTSARTSTELLTRAFTPAQKLTDIAVVLNNSTPEHVWLTGVSLERGGSVIVRGSALTSEDVAKYLETLSRDERFRDVKPLFANNARIEETPVVQFSLSAFPVGNLPLAQRQSGRLR